MATVPNGPFALEVRNLTVEFPSRQGWRRVVDDVSFAIPTGQVTGLVGESGSGKSVTAMAVIGLLGHRGGRVAQGSVLLDGVDLLACGERELREIRGARIGTVFQHAARGLNPSIAVGEQIAEVARRHLGLARRVAHDRAVEVLEGVGIREPAQVAGRYPHQLSGGMCQRVMIAMALVCEPRLLIADEPTTALDVRVQERILALLRDVHQASGVSVLFISHDLPVVGEISDRVAVMYAGQIVEEASVGDVFASPRHPYTAGLLATMPVGRRRRFTAIPGSIPDPGSWPEGCRFAPRCALRDPATCDSPQPIQLDAGGARSVRCGRAVEALGAVAAR
ncbi:MAG: ABC transporter ATP-binding protein [Acidimicrobiia bacterium]